MKKTFYDLSESQKTAFFNFFKETILDTEWSPSCSKEIKLLEDKFGIKLDSEIKEVLFNHEIKKLLAYAKENNFVTKLEYDDTYGISSSLDIFDNDRLRIFVSYCPDENDITYRYRPYVESLRLKEADSLDEILEGIEASKSQLNLAEQIANKIKEASNNNIGVLKDFIEENELNTNIIGFVKYAIEHNLHIDVQIEDYMVKIIAKNDEHNLVMDYDCSENPRYVWNLSRTQRHARTTRYYNIPSDDLSQHVSRAVEAILIRKKEDPDWNEYDVYAVYSPNWQLWQLLNVPFGEISFEDYVAHINKVHECLMNVLSSNPQVSSLFNWEDIFAKAVLTQIFFMTLFNIDAVNKIWDAEGKKGGTMPYYELAEEYSEKIEFYSADVKILLDTLQQNILPPLLFK